MLRKFREVTKKRHITGKCYVCGKKFTRVVSVTHTINPYNLNLRGRMKSPQEVEIDVLQELDDICSKINAHASCYYKDVM